MRINVARLLCSAVVLACVPVVATPAARVQAVSPDVVISQVYGAGGNAGAVLRNDYIELFNRGTTTVSLDGWSVQYASATGTGNFAANPVTNLRGSLAPGQYYLVQQATGGSERQPAPDAGRVRRGQHGGRRRQGDPGEHDHGPGCATVRRTPCSAAQLAQIVDLVGYGGANFFEGTGGADDLDHVGRLPRRQRLHRHRQQQRGLRRCHPHPRNTAAPLLPCGGVTVPGLSIGDASTVEGNDGTTTLVFDVALSGAAGEGGVTFDIATADGTAQDASAAGEDADYVAQSLTGQVIPAGGSGPYSFSVTVNGDTAVETDETFLVAVTNVVGANVADGQATGTIEDDDLPPCDASITPIYRSRALDWRRR